MTGTDPLNPDRLYDLLPQVVRDSDAFAGQPLRALFRILTAEAGHVEDDILGLYRNWFVETCDPWVLPYLAEVLGYRVVPEIAPPAADDSPRGRERARMLHPRREYARTIHHRRRKGVLLQLQELARDVTGWPARAVEYRKLMAAAWSSQGRDPRRLLGLADEDVVDRGFGPFDALPRRPDLRKLGQSPMSGRGAVGAVGLWVWRLKSHQVQEGEAWHAAGDFPRGARKDVWKGVRLERYTLNPHGVDQPLFVRPDPLPDPVGPTGETEVPGPLRPLALRTDLATRAGVFYGETKSLYLKTADELPAATGGTGPTSPLGPDQVRVADLAGWEESLPSNHPLVADPCGPAFAVIDPVRGRVLLRRGPNDPELAVVARFHTAGGRHRRRGLLPRTSRADRGRVPPHRRRPEVPHPRRGADGLAENAIAGPMDHRT
jgi:hypothetical protein